MDLLQITDPQTASSRNDFKLQRQSPACIAILLFLLAWGAHHAGAQGALTNGWTHTGTISPVGDSDTWTFSASVGDRIVIRVGEITQTGSFTPRIRLNNPSAVLVATASSSSSAEIVFTATNTGTFTVVADDAVGTSATGTYRLTLVKSPGAVFVAPGDEGGPMTNGVLHTGTILLGDLDLWTFTATSGDNLVVRMGQITDTNTFFTWVRLYGPDGALLRSSLDSTAAEVSLQATNSGTFIVVVGDGNGGLFGSGDYRLTLAKTGDPVVVSAGDDGGPMTNGVMHTGTILLGDLDLWTFTANNGDNFVVRMGQITDISTFYPWVRLYGPDGALLRSSVDSTVAEVSMRATNSGTFIVVVGDGNGGLFGSGDYLLTLAKTGEPVVVSAGDNGGPLTNGVLHTGTILLGDLDMWTFTANNGDNLVVRMGQITDISTFYPWVRLYGPDGALLRSSVDSTVAEVSMRATNSGTFIVVVGDGNGGLFGSGDYLLTLAKTGEPVVVSAGDNGGPMTNGVLHTGTILLGDLDMWTFTANNGDNLVVRMGQITDISTFYPWVRLYGPDGALLRSSVDSTVAEVSMRATNSGTFIVVVGDGNGGLFGSGDYLLTLAKTGEPVVVSAGDNGGPLTNGVLHTGTILLGDLDMWTFTANNGDNLVVRMGQITDISTFYPWVRLYGPDGALLRSSVDSTVAEVSMRATNSGTFIVVVGDGNGGLFGSGDYLLTLAKTGEPVVVSAGDNGGPMTNGVMHTGTILTGDLDMWTFTANNGDNLVVRMGQITDTNTFYPWVRLYGPDGALLRASFDTTAAEVSIRPTNSGTFIVVVGDGNGALSGSGDYRLTLAKTGDPIVTSAGDDGGPLNGASTYDGTIETGDLDLFYFTACLGDSLVLQMDELVGGSSLTPWLRLYGRDGTLIRSVSGTATALISMTATNAGTFTLLAGDGNGALSGTGAYRLTLNGLSAGLKLCVPVLSGTNVILGGIGGTPGATFVLYTHTNVTTPFWTPLRTNQFDQFGLFSYTNAFNKAEPERYYRLVVP